MEILNKALQLMREDAEKRGENAAYGGRHDDGGKRGMLGQISAFEDGMNYIRHSTYPEWLMPYVDQVTIQEDPDYNEYIRLKAKFE